MITVFKYLLNPYETEVQLPAGADVLSVAFQGDDLCMWAKVDTSSPLEGRHFKVFPTGVEIPTDMGIDYDFIGTAHTYDGSVFHVFEQIGLYG